MLWINRVKFNKFLNNFDEMKVKKDNCNTGFYYFDEINNKWIKMNDIEKIIYLEFKKEDG